MYNTLPIEAICSFCNQLVHVQLVWSTCVSIVFLLPDPSPERTWARSRSRDQGQVSGSWPGNRCSKTVAEDSHAADNATCGRLDTWRWRRAVTSRWWGVLTSREWRIVASRGRWNSDVTCASRQCSYRLWAYRMWPGTKVTQTRLRLHRARWWSLLRHRNLASVWRKCVFLKHWYLWWMWSCCIYL